METVSQATAFFYTQFDVFCIIIMGILLSTILIDVDRNSYRYCQMSVITAVMLFCIVDISWVLVYENVIPATVTSRTITNVFLYCGMNSCAYSVFYLLEENLQSVSKIKWNKKYTRIPFVLLMLIPLVTPWTGALFTINADNSFQRGPLYIPYVVVIFASLIPTELRAILLGLKAENEAYGEQCFTVAINAIPVFIGSIIHFFFPTLPSITAGITIAVMQFYIMQIREQISIDALTGINNRKQGERFFSRHINAINQQEKPLKEGLYLFIADLNKFKSINDTYGHAEGDHALTVTAEALRDSCARHADKCMLCRFGGDEFVIGGMFESDEQADSFSEILKSELAQKCSTKDLPYSITVSIGYERYSKDFKSLKNLLSAADKKMYEQKKGMTHSA